MKKRKGLSMRYQITSDSTCDLNPEQLEQYNIRLLPLYVSMDGKTLRDGVDVKPDDIYAHVSAGGSLPQTAAVNLADYVRAFTELSKKKRLRHPRLYLSGLLLLLPERKAGGGGF